MEAPEKFYGDIENDLMKKCVHEAFKAGAQWQKEQIIDKACEYFYKKLNNGDMECGDIVVFIEDFKKAMEE